MTSRRTNTIEAALTASGQALAGYVVAMLGAVGWCRQAVNRPKHSVQVLEGVSLFATAALSVASGTISRVPRDAAVEKPSRVLVSHTGVPLSRSTTFRFTLVARHVSDAAFGQFRRQLEYKAAWYGTEVVVADRWFPSSKTCSGCGTINANLTLSDRVYDCGGCGLLIDRDVNAAVNLARYSPPPPKASPLPAAA